MGSDKDRIMSTLSKVIRQATLLITPTSNYA